MTFYVAIVHSVLFRVRRDHSMHIVTIVSFNKEVVP